MRVVRAAVLVSALLGFCFACAKKDPANGSPAPTRAEIWSAIQPAAERYRLDPAFVYALVAAESNFDAKSRKGEARGLLQLTPAAWRAVSSVAYEPNVWNWRSNLEAGIDYLAYSRSELHKKSNFSYPLLLAAFHYGLDYVEDRGFDITRVAVPESDIYRELWRGNFRPVAPPSSNLH